VLLFLLAAVAAASAGAARESESHEAPLRHLKEVLWLKAYAEQDQELLDAILADEFQMVDADGNWTTKAAELD
jgi:hypothetical protein